MMNLRELIEAGERKAGSGRALAERLGLRTPHLSDAKTGGRGLPNEAAVKLARYLNKPEIEVIAASELATAKSEEAKAIWRPLARAAAISSAAFVTLFVTSPTESHAQSKASETPIQGNANYPKK